MKKTNYYVIFLLLFSIFFSCTVINENNDNTLKGIQKIIEDKTIPSDLANYDNMSELIFSNYIPGATVVARYVKEIASGAGDGSSWDNASSNIQGLLNEINDASKDRVYVILIASGTYKPDTSYTMKKHVALVGGFTAGSYDQAGKTHLDGNNNKRVFNNNDLDRTALLYGAVIINGKVHDGGGMYNESSASPTLINVTFSDNKANTNGGGMYNESSASPTLINVTFSDNKANTNGGGMYNESSASPTLNNTTFLGNEAQNGGGMYNISSSPTLNNTTFLGNEAQDGGGMYNISSSPTLNNITFSGNEAQNGGGMYNISSSPTLNNVTFSGNKGNYFGGGMYNISSTSTSISFPTLINVVFSGNTAGNHGGGLYSDTSSPVLVNVTFSDNTVNNHHGGGIYHDGNGEPLTLINTILWNNENNKNGNIYLHNDSANTEIMNLYYSLIAGGIAPSTTATGIRLNNDDTSIYPVTINSKEVIDEDPGLGTLANYGGEINTISIGNNSPAKDKGVYVKGVKSKTENLYPEANLYYSKNNTDWYSDPGLTTQEIPPNNADNITATDARGYSRVGRPDMGAYEEGGTQ